MKIFYLLLLVLTVSSFYSESTNISVEITGIDQLKGQLMLAVFDDEDNFPNSDKALMRIVHPVTATKESISISNLVKGKKYAIAVYHDLNKNGRLDKNFLGIPIEKYGFSNGARAMFSAPTFSEAGFSCADNMYLKIVIY